MTTSVEIFAHVWPVSVVALDRVEDGSISAMPLTNVEPHTSRRESVWQGRQLLITEMKQPESPADQGDDT